MNTVIKGITGLRNWVDDRFPLMSLWNDHIRVTTTRPKISTSGIILVFFQ